MIYVVTERNLLAGRILDGLWDGEEVCEDSEVRLHKNMRIFEYTTEYTRNYDYDTMSSYAKLLDIHLSSIRISYDCNTI